MNLSKQLFCRVGAALLCIILMPGWPIVFGQESVPREYGPEEYISLNSNMRISDALEIINQFATKYDNKIITDSKEQQGPIGVTVDHMHWKRAFEYILRANKLSYIEHPRHYEIVGEQKKPDNEEELNLDTREIEINAIFFEADYASISEVGVDWTTVQNGQVRIRADSYAGSQVSQGLFTLQAATSKLLNVSALIKVFESRNKGQVIASPQIRIMDGEEGKIKVGRNFFLTTRDFAGNTRYSEYEAGTILTVRPQIMLQDDQTFVHLEITAEKSDVEIGAIGVTKKITEGRTQVLLLNGEETALAGLFSNERSAVRKGIPLLKDLPWWFFGLRYLMGYNSDSFQKKELIILIKPLIVPSLKTRLRSKVQNGDLLEQKRREFYRNSQKLK